VEDQSLIYAKQHKREFLELIFSGKEIPKRKTAIFMAGSPGAGKTEVAAGLADLNENFCMIDADAFRTQFPGYNGKNSSEFQRGASKLVDLAFTEAIKKGYSFILDGTFAIERAHENIERVLKRGYFVRIYYVYQNPIIAWNFTKSRELAEGRVVPKERFINAFFKSRENLMLVKARFKEEVEIHIVMKDYQNAISEIHFDMDNVDMILPPLYTAQKLEVLLND